MALELKVSQFPFAHRARHDLPQGFTLFDSYHCSRYNTQTKRLTKDMFNQIFTDIDHYLSPVPTRSRRAGS
jgi:uracil-DNA glycosylase